MSIGNNNEILAKEIVECALKKARTLKLPKAAVAVFDQKGSLLAVETYGKGREKAEKECKMKVKSLIDNKKLTEIAGFKDVFKKLLGKLGGKNDGVQGVVKIKELGYISAMCIFDSSKDVQVLHETLLELGYISENGKIVWATHKEYVFPDPGWTTYSRKKT